MDSSDRDKVMEKYVHDAYFEKGNLWLKIRQTIFTILGWLLVIIPIYWTLSATVFVKKNFMKQIWSYQEGKDLFYSFGRFFLIAFIVLAVVTILFTLHNNYYTKHHVKEHVEYDQERLLSRRNAIKNFYTDEFGDADTRRNHTRFYSVTPEQNLDVNTIDNIYKKHEEEK